MKPTFIVLLSVVLFSSSVFSQGSLTPPGAPEPGMKTLAQIEPRIDLQAIPAPAGVVTTDPDYHFIITRPGSYYLSANVGVTKLNGIRIDAEAVTLDLNGFGVSRNSAFGNGWGIEVTDGSHGASIRNGSVRHFAFGVRSVARSSYLRDLSVSGCSFAGIYMAGPGALLEFCRAYDNQGSWGIYAGSGATLTHCSAVNNIAFAGIRAGTGSTLSNCAASENTADVGFLVTSGSTLSHCTASNNVSSAAFTAGFSVGPGSTISHCTARMNTSTAATLTPFTGQGFEVGEGSIIKNSTTYRNRGNGIRLYNGATALANSSRENGYGGLGAGIYAESHSRIEGNYAFGNTQGFQVTSSGNLILRNSAKANTINYQLAANNVFGAIVDRTAPASGSVAGNIAVSSAGTTDPWANFSH